MARRQKGADWLETIAAATEAHAAPTKGADGTLVCASGISPSGPIHMGNLREAMTTHLIAEALRARGREVVHVHSWDDYDRFRKVPAGQPEWMADFIGQPLCDIPDPGEEYPSWGHRHMHDFEQSCARIGIEARWTRQSVMYRDGTYQEAVHDALAGRLEIFDILAKYQTESRQEVPLEERRRRYWPYRVYCPACSTDAPELVSYDDEARVLRYRCACNGEERDTCLTEESIGKLVWKVDWPMRWAHEKVDFEPGGEDHSTPGSSYTVGKEIVGRFGWQAPSYAGYGFVGMSGSTKMSSSLGQAPTPGFALEFIEPALMRWLYLRRAPRTQFSIDFGAEIWRQYDEWDSYRRRAVKQEVPPLHHRVIAHSLKTSTGEVTTPQTTVGFRVLSGAADICSGNRAQIARIVRDHLDGDCPDEDEALLAQLEPRLSCALGWVEHCMPDEDRVRVRASFSSERWAELTEEELRAVSMLLDGLEDNWGLTALTSHVYAVPKRMAGLPLDVKPTPELKQAQRAFFRLLYELLLDDETGPRLPTLLLSLGVDRVRELLGQPPAGSA